MGEQLFSAFRLSRKGCDDLFAGGQKDRLSDSLSAQHRPTPHARRDPGAVALDGEPSVCLWSSGS